MSIQTTNIEISHILSNNPSELIDILPNLMNTITNEINNSKSISCVHEFDQSIKHILSSGITKSQFIDISKRALQVVIFMLKLMKFTMHLIKQRKNLISKRIPIIPLIRISIMISAIIGTYIITGKTIKDSINEIKTDITKEIMECKTYMIENK